MAISSLPPGSEGELFDIRPPDGVTEMNQAGVQKNIKQRKSDVHFKLAYKISGMQKCVVITYYYSYILRIHTVRETLF